MRRIQYLLIAIVLAMMPGGCITGYDPQLDSESENLLVVDGFISDGETVISLSRSIGLGGDQEEGAYGDRWITGANVLIESESGEIYTAHGSSEGRYIATIPSLDDATRYRLRITLNGEEYESSWRHPQSTPEFEFEFVENGDTVEAQLSVRGEDDRPGYYFWSYSETWEARAPFNATHYYGAYEGDYTQYSLRNYSLLLMNGNPEDDLFLFEYPGGLSPFYYCWKYNNSRELLIGSTERLETNELRGHVLYGFDINSDRSSVLYNTVITQYAMDEDAYYYFENQKRNTDQSGSIFAPIPSEMQGNIVCASSPEIQVIGFVEVSRRVKHDIWARRDEMPYRPDHNVCTTSEDPRFTQDLNWEQYAYRLRYPEPAYTTLECIDCRVTGGTKVRPEGWPNQNSI